jgi:capsular exopolysaccharide synthesis family protein
VAQSPDTLTFADALGVLRRRLPLIALCTVIVVAAAYGYSKHETKMYTASASLLFLNNPLNQQIAGLPPASTGNLLAQQASNLELVRLGDMAARTAGVLGHGLTAEKVAGALSIAGQGESSVVGVSATATSPTLAAAIANTYTREFVTEQQTANRQYFRSALALVNGQLAGLPPAQRFGPDGLALQNRAQTLHLLSELSYGNVQLAQQALPPTGPSSPSTSRNTALGVLLGLLIGVGLAFALERLDDRIRHPEELEAIYGAPLLGVVPFTASRRRGRPPGTALDRVGENFRLIRAHLRIANPDRHIQAILIASGEQHGGTTTVACRLAEAEASAGSKVLLLEASLRHPTLAAQLGLQPGPGLVEVLGGTVSMSEAARPVKLQAADERLPSRLDVLSAGALPYPNPAELLESDDMSALLEQARSSYDSLVIDAPALGDVSDAFALLTRVDGVLIVGRVAHSRRDTAERLHRLLSGTGVALLGVIASGAGSRRAILPTRLEGERPAAAGSSTNGTAPEHLTTAGV